MVRIGPQAGIIGPEGHLLRFGNDCPGIFWTDKVALGICESPKHVKDSGIDRLPILLIDDALGKVATLFVRSGHRGRFQAIRRIPFTFPGEEEESLVFPRINLWNAEGAANRQPVIALMKWLLFHAECIVVPVVGVEIVVASIVEQPSMIIVRAALGRNRNNTT